MSGLSPDLMMLSDAHCVRVGTVDTELLTEVRTGGGKELDSLLGDWAVRADSVTHPPGFNQNRVQDVSHAQVL